MNFPCLTKGTIKYNEKSLYTSSLLIGEINRGLPSLYLVILTGTKSSVWITNRLVSTSLLIQVLMSSLAQARHLPCLHGTGQFVFPSGSLRLYIILWNLATLGSLGCTGYVSAFRLEFVFLWRSKYSSNSVWRSHILAFRSQMFHPLADR